MSARSAPMLKMAASGRGVLSISQLMDIATSKQSDNEAVLSAAWMTLHGDLPADISEKFYRGGFLDAAFTLCEIRLGSRLKAWTLEYFTSGGPYDATLQLRDPDLALTGHSDLSAAAAVVVALLKLK